MGSKIQPASKSNAVDFRLGFQGASANASEVDESLFSDAEAKAAVAPPELVETVAAKMPELFVGPFSRGERLFISQPRHFASVAKGLREKPVVQRVVTYQMPHGESWKTNLTAHANSGALTLVGIPQQFGEDGFYAVQSIALKTGAVSRIDVPVTTGRLTSGVPLRSVNTRNGVAFYFKADAPTEIDTTHFIANVDSRNERCLWTREVSSNPNFDVQVIHETRNGDIVSIGSTNERHSDEHYAQLTRFNGETGDTIYNVKFPLPDGALLDPHVFFYDAQSETALVSSFLGARAAATLHNVQLATGAMQTVGNVDLRFSDSLYTICQLSNDTTLFLPYFQSASKTAATWLRFSGDGKVELRKMPLDDTKMTSGTPAIANASQTHAVQLDYQSLSFFELSSGKIELIAKRHFDKRLKKDRYRPNEHLAMTQDNVVYYSHRLALTWFTKELKCRLYAFDATTGEELWTHDQKFKCAPTISVNDDGSIAWADTSRAVILGKQPKARPGIAK